MDIKLITIKEESLATKLLTFTIKEKNMSKIERILIRRDEMTEEEAKEVVAEAREMIADGENPEDVLYDLGLEPDYIFDLI